MMRTGGRGAVRGCLVGAALAVALAGCANGVGDTASPASPPPGSTPSSGAPGSDSGAARQSGGPVPPGFIAQDFTFVSADQGWLLGTAPCSSSPCTSIVRTADGGRDWAGAPAPRADLEPNGQNGCDADKPCVRGLRFANGSIGYAYGSTALYLTRDGGATWSRQPGQADAIEVGDGTAVRVSHGTQGCPPGCAYRVSTAPVASTAWRDVTVPGTLTGNGVQLLRAGHHAFLAVYRNPAGGAGDAHATLATSADDGQHWATHPDPCGTEGGQEADSEQLAAGPDGSLTVLCRVRAGDSGFVVTSTDGGASFGPRHRTPGASPDAVGAAGLRVLLMSSGGTAYRSTDAGASWAAVASAPVPSPAAPGRTSPGPGVIGFESASTGRWVPGSGVVLTTTDGGRSWTTFRFPA